MCQERLGAHFMQNVQYGLPNLEIKGVSLVEVVKSDLKLLPLPQKQSDPIST